MKNQKTTHIATLGWTEEAVTLLATSYPIDRLILLTSDDEDSIKTAEKISRDLEKYNFEIRIEYVDAYNFVDVFMN